MNEADVLLLTSFREGSPQVIKEALACNLPIVSVNVGDVQEIIQDADNCFVVAHDPVEIAEAVETVFKNQRRSKDGRIRVQGLELMAVAHKILSIYNRVLE
jgi:glycosyltransferase involved in cell wall biosynthesis